MELELHDAPFQYITAKNVLDPEALEQVWREVRFLSHPEKLNRPGVDHGAGGLGGATNSRAAALEEVYARQEVSDIIHHATEVTAALGEAAADRWPHFYRARHPECIATKLRYYHDGDQYDTHNDWRHEYLLFLYIHSEPKAFTGGQLFFEEHGLEFEAENNTCLFVPGYIMHGVRRVSIPENDYWSGRGRYCISQFISSARSDGYGR